jgi:hypothetical protein
VKRLLERLRRRRVTEAPVERLVRGLGEPPAAGTADDAELDALRGELVRELDRMANKGEGGAAPTGRDAASSTG